MNLVNYKNKSFIMTIYLENMDNIISHHPVHILDADAELSPSSFIPFCEFGSNKRMGMKNDKFSFFVDGANYKEFRTESGKSNHINSVHEKKKYPCKFC